MVLREELEGALEITRVELCSTHADHAVGSFYDFEVLLCETGVSSLSTDFEDNYGGAVPVTVLGLDTLAIDWRGSSPGWNGFDLEEPFSYGGMDNLIVEFRYLGDDGHTVNARAADLPSADRCLSGPHPSSPTGSPMSFLTCMRIHFEEQDLEPATFAGIKVLLGTP